VILRQVADRWPFAALSAAVPALLQALDLLEVAVVGPFRRSIGGRGGLVPDRATRRRGRVLVVPRHAANTRQSRQPHPVCGTKRAMRAVKTAAPLTWTRWPQCGSASASQCDATARGRSPHAGCPDGAALVYRTGRSSAFLRGLYSGARFTRASWQRSSAVADELSTRPEANRQDPDSAC